MRESNKKQNFKIAAIIQARMGSERLPGKVLVQISGKPMIWHVVNRLRFSKKIDDIILAIPNSKENDKLEKFAKENKIKYFRGSEEDVLSRYYQAAKRFKCDLIIRITGDCPLIDPKIIDMVISKHLNSNVDYSTNTFIGANNLKITFPRGFDAEIFYFKNLEKAYKETKEDYGREHVTPYIKEHPGIFNLQNIEAEGKFRRPELRLAVDTKEDLELIRTIYKYLYKPPKIFYAKEIISLFNKHPELIKINIAVKQKRRKIQ